MTRTQWLIVERKIEAVFKKFPFGYICIEMATTNEIRNRVIESLMSINDPDYLKALEDMIKNSNVKHSAIPLTEEQKIMLAMSEEDIKNGRVIDQESLNKKELEWLTKK